MFGLSPEAWTAIGTIVLAALTAVLGGVGVLQFRAFNKAEKRATDSSQQALRAYVSTTDNNALEIGITEIAEERFDLVNVKVGLVNTGQTPARRLIIHNAQLRSEVDDPDFPVLTRTSTVPDIGKNQSMELLLVWTHLFVPLFHSTGLLKQPITL